MVLEKQDKEKEQVDLDEKLRLVRAHRYYCQSVAKLALPAERVSICLRNRITVPSENRIEDIKVWKHRKTHKAFYSGLMTCGSVWMCPICAAKISERRRRELNEAFDQHKKEGGHIAMLTLTFSHTKTDSLKNILSLFAEATKKFMSGRAYQNIREEIGLIGRIRALEVTYGKNGFHPHAHILLFYTKKVKLDDIKDKMYPLWEKACAKVNLKVNDKHGLKLDSGAEANNYVTKHGQWGLDQEMTKAHIKKGKNDSLKPFDFLSKYIETEDEKYLILFREYVECFKGKRQLQWSQGLKKRFVLEDKTDEEIAREKSEEADLLGMIDYLVWKKILKNDRRSYFLDLCESHNFEEALSIIKKEKNL